MAASSATWTADTLADIIGFPLAGLFVAFLGTEASQLVAGILRRLGDVRPVGCPAGDDRRRTTRPRGRSRRHREPCAHSPNELVEGWHFLRTRAPLIQNTIISAVAQMTVGVTLALTVVYATRRARRLGHPVSARTTPRSRRRSASATWSVGWLSASSVPGSRRAGWSSVASSSWALATIVLGLTIERSSSRWPRRRSWASPISSTSFRPRRSSSRSRRSS